MLQNALVENPPSLIRDGGVIAEDFDTLLDELRNISENASQFLKDLEIREQQRTGISTLKVGYNKVHGYYIEITRGQSNKAPADYIRRQTLKNQERFITPELKSFEDKALSSHSRALAREKVLYDNLLDVLLQDLAPMQAMAAGLAELDVLSNLAERMDSLQLVLPEMTTTPGIAIEQGRHPVVEATLEGSFIANDTLLHDKRRMLIITGPNMGGKSTYMRQVALITLLAHVGSAVPAKRATIGPVDRIFTRIGAADDLAGGRSTFMVEMTEAANILHNATEQSLVLLDEIGRGTSTYDGLALAFACAHHLSETIKATCLFATHYFELTQLPEQLAATFNVHFAAKEHHERIVFLHSLKEGPANRSYGIQVAQLAGVPKCVIQQAKAQLQQLEAKASGEKPVAALAPAITPNVEQSAQHPVIQILKTLNPNELTPKEALDYLYQLSKTIHETTDNESE